jgi:hypothetical protein
MRLLLSSLAIATILVVAPSTSHAQRAMYNPSAAGNLGGTSYRPYTANAYSRQAVTHAQVLQHYGKNNESIPQETAQEHVAEIRRNSDAFAKEISKLPKEFENDADAKALIVEIREHQAQAAVHCGMLEAECAKRLAAGGKVAECCTTMLTHLQAADAAHEKLMKHLGIAMPRHSVTDAAKVEVKADVKK